MGEEAENGGGEWSGRRRDDLVALSAVIFLHFQGQWHRLCPLCTGVLQVKISMRNVGQDLRRALGDPTTFVAPVDTYATRLLAHPLSVEEHRPWSL